MLSLLCPPSPSSIAVNLPTQIITGIVTTYTNTNRNNMSYSFYMPYTFTLDNTNTGIIIFTDQDNNSVTISYTSGIGYLITSQTGSNTFTSGINTNPFFIHMAIIPSWDTDIVFSSDFTMATVTITNDIINSSQAGDTTAQIPTVVPSIFINMQQNTVTLDVLTVVFLVYDNINNRASICCNGKNKDCGFGVYCGNILDIESNGIAGTQFQVYLLTVGCTVKGEGTMEEKVTAFRNAGLSVDLLGFTGYILLKILLGKLTIDYSFNIKWAYTDNYEELIFAVSQSIYSDFITDLNNNIGYEQLLLPCCTKYNK